MIYRMEDAEKMATVTPPYGEERLKELEDKNTSLTSNLSSLTSSVNGLTTKVNGLTDFERKDVQIWGKMNIWAKLTKFKSIGLVLCYLDGRDNFVQSATSPAESAIPEGWRPVDQIARAAGFIGAQVATICIYTDGRLFFWEPVANNQQAEINAFLAWRVNV